MPPGSVIIAQVSRFPTCGENILPTILHDVHCALRLLVICAAFDSVNRVIHKPPPFLISLFLISREHNCLFYLEDVDV